MNIIVTNTVRTGNTVTITGTTDAGLRVRVVGQDDTPLGPDTTSASNGGAFTVTYTVPDPAPATVRIQVGENPGKGYESVQPVPAAADRSPVPPSA